MAENKIFYEKFVSNPNENIRLTVANATHLFVRNFLPSNLFAHFKFTSKTLQTQPTDNYGVGCTENAEHSYYLGNCSYSGAKHALEFLLPDVFTTSSFNSEGIFIFFKILTKFLQVILMVFRKWILGESTQSFQSDGIL